MNEATLLKCELQLNVFIYSNWGYYGMCVRLLPKYTSLKKNLSALSFYDLIVSVLLFFIRNK